MFKHYSFLLPPWWCKVLLLFPLRACQLLRLTLQQLNLKSLIDRWTNQEKELCSFSPKWGSAPQNAHSGSSNHLQTLTHGFLRWFVVEVEGDGWKFSILVRLDGCFSSADWAEASFYFYPFSLIFLLFRELVSRSIVDYFLAHFQKITFACVFLLMKSDRSL